MFFSFDGVTDAGDEVLHHPLVRLRDVETRFIRFARVSLEHMHDVQQLLRGAGIALRGPVHQLLDRGHQLAHRMALAASVHDDLFAERVFQGGGEVRVPFGRPLGFPDRPFVKRVFDGVFL
jgi:hypothetical protein